MSEFLSPITAVRSRSAPRALIGADTDVRHLSVQPIEADVLEQWRVAVDTRDDARVAQLVQFAHALRDIGKPLLGDGG